MGGKVIEIDQPLSDHFLIVIMLWHEDTGLFIKFLEKSSLSVKFIRDAFYQCADIAEFDGAMQKGTELGIKTWETEDGQEGLKSFLEKRPPVWKNK